MRTGTTLGFVGAVLVGALALLGASRTLAQSPPGGAPAHGVPGSMPGTMHVDAGRHFIQEMIPHHEDAVTMTALASAQAEHPELRELAATIHRVQTDEIAQMRAWYQAWYGTAVPPSMMAAMGGAMPGPPGLPGGRGHAAALDGAQPFDKAFIEQMVPHHQQAVMMATMALQGADRPELRALLQSIITSQSAEIEQMREWYQRWYGTPLPQGMGMGGAGTDHSHAGMGTGAGPAGPEEAARQAQVAARGAQVMPFDLTRTTHAFTDTDTGGREAVTADDPADTPQIGLIRAHLEEEARKFAGGDFSDPATLHGEEMPGLAALRAGYGRVAFAYEEMPDGAALTYRTADPVMVAVLHTWFAAQRSDHGGHGGHGGHHPGP